MRRVRFARADYAGSIAALHENWAGDPASLIASIQAGGEVERGLLDWLVGFAAGEGDLDEAIFVTEIECELWPRDEWLWNNLGLFLRDSTEARYGRSTRGKDEETAALMLERYERSYAAYARAVELVPTHPVFLNDGAVILDYYLQRDYDRAMEMYRTAAEHADAWLARDDQGEQELQALRLAKRDSNNNMRILERKIERVRGGD